jgi:DNA polymerase I
MSTSLDSGEPLLTSPDRTEHLLYGSDPYPGIVAVERSGKDQVRIFQRKANKICEQYDRFRPWLLAARPAPWSTLRPQPQITELSGEHPLRFLVEFSTWPGYLDAARAGRDANETFFQLRSPVEQYLVRSGRTLFKGMVFDDLRRLQIDIETLGFDARQPDASVIAIALRSAGGIEEVLTLETTEADLILQLTERLRELDPDAIEGHNIFNFDLPFLAMRAEQHDVSLLWGRDGSPVTLSEGQARFKVGALTLPFSPVYIHGRHVIDTYQQIQRYDTAGRLSSYGLKTAVEELGLTRPDRQFIPGEQIRAVWMSDPDRLLQYALDDVRDVDILSTLATPTEFYQTQLVPRSFQAVATGGPGEKINDLMVRAYVMLGHSLPVAGAARGYPGGHAELLQVGTFSPVVKCDVESLYPSIMLTQAISAKGDVLNAYLPMLEDLTRRRLDAKARSQSTRGRGREAEHAMWDGMQSSFKVLINSFYGYLGYGGGLFNDYDAAERVTVEGQRIVKDVVRLLSASGSTPIEVDTDGVYFVPREGMASEDEERAYIEMISEALPPGIRLTHDGRYSGMLSLRLKTYALLDYDDGMILKGSSLRNRRMEPCFRQFLRDAAHFFLTGANERARDAYFSLGERIRDRSLEPSEFRQWAMIHEDTLAKHPRLQRLAALSAAGRVPRSGDRLEVYERENGELGLIAAYDGDESIPYLLRRLREVAERFRDLFPSSAEFEAFFPALSVRTDLEAARAERPAEQLGMFM